MTLSEFIIAANHRVFGREISWQATSSKRTNQKSSGMKHLLKIEHLFINTQCLKKQAKLFFY